MKSGVESLQRSERSRLEAERQLAAAVERHGEVLASMRELGRPESGQHVAVKAVGRAVHLVSFALRHAAESGVPLDRLVEVTGWEPELVSEAVARALTRCGRPPRTSWHSWHRRDSTPAPSRRLPRVRRRPQT